MDAVGVLRDLFERSREAISVVPALSDDELYAEPIPSIAWCAWRMGRSIDYNVSGLMGEEQMWTADGWAARFGMPPEPRDFLPGFPPPNETVRTFRAPSGQALYDCFEATLKRTYAYLGTLTPADLDRELDGPRLDPRPTVSVRLVSVAVSAAQASGPIRYRLWMAGKR